MSTVEINIEGDIAPEAAEAARRRLASLYELVVTWRNPGGDEPPEDAAPPEVVEAAV